MPRIFATVPKNGLAFLGASQMVFGYGCFQFFGLEKLRKVSHKVARRILALPYQGKRYVVRLRLFLGLCVGGYGIVPSPFLWVFVKIHLWRFLVTARVHMFAPSHVSGQRVSHGINIKREAMRPTACRASVAAVPPGVLLQAVSVFTHGRKYLG